MSLAGKTAVVTGGASGIGRAIARYLAGAGVHVAVFDVTPADAGARTLALRVDVGDTAGVERAVVQTRETLGPIQILANVAGIAGFAPLLQMSEEEWDRMLRVHLKGTFNCTRAIAPDMVAAGWGRIVNVSSAAGLNGGGPGLAHYAAAKAGIIGFTKAIAHELGPFGVTANAIAPGLVDTPMIRQAGAPPDLYDTVVQRSPVRRIGTPEDIAAAAAYLISEEASFTTGQVLSPNGGTVL